MKFKTAFFGLFLSNTMSGFQLIITCI